MSEKKRDNGQQKNESHDYQRPGENVSIERREYNDSYQPTTNELDDDNPPGED